MKSPDIPEERLLESLQERAKELDCLYRVEEILNRFDDTLDRICVDIIEAISPGWRFPEICTAKITIDGEIYAAGDFAETPWFMSADVAVKESVVGSIKVYYTEELPPADNGPFLKEEVKLLRTIAERLGHFLLDRRMNNAVEKLNTADEEGSESSIKEWKVVLEMLRQTDRNLYFKIAHKMLNQLRWSGLSEAENLFRVLDRTESTETPTTGDDDWNIPNKMPGVDLSDDFCSKIFRFADANLGAREILKSIQKWIQEDKISFLGQAVNRNRPLAELADALRRYHHLVEDEETIGSPGNRSIAVSLIRRVLGDQLQFVSVAKDFIRSRDFHLLLKNVIFCSDSYGKLGGKGSGLFLAAQILKEQGKGNTLLEGVKIPKTWYIVSDAMLDFMHYNNFDDVFEQKYKEINQVRLEYPHIIQTFKSGYFPPEVVNGLSVALDEIGDRPLIIRSSSLLEDRVGAAFSGKYKSLFLANQGSKKERLAALTDAIAEIYASVFGPDPIEYRAERGLIDFGEEMGILIQEVVGSRMGEYFLPAYAGVALSNNEMRWSPRIGRKDGLVRIVPGLGTRAVDRLSDDYPILFAPGQPGLRINVTADEIVRYSPKKIDVINLESNSFETIELGALLGKVGFEYPKFRRIVSIFNDGHVQKTTGFEVDFEKDELVATFEGLIADTPFVKQMRAVLKILEEAFGKPVDIEFAFDGTDFYLLQCRTQSDSDHSQPAPIPRDIPGEQILFSANRFVSNGRVPDITHIVLVDPEKYAQIPDRSSLDAVGRVVGKLNKLLPKRQFILMGPGRWGSRGDIRLGVNVTYSDINNTAVLAEIALKKGSYLPDLSFGTHFFQDLVEANIRYLPLYPSDEGTVYNELFLTRSKNILPEILPEFAHLAETVRLIDVPAATGGKVLKVLMNADLDEALGILAEPGGEIAAISGPDESQRPLQESFWRWRMHMAERIAASLDVERHGVAAIYVFGSAKNGTAGPGSDIDLLVHFRGTANQLDRLRTWLEGWSLSLAEMNYMRTGYRTDGLLDVHFVTDEDISRKTSFAAKIGAVTDAARPLPMNNNIT